MLFSEAGSNMRAAQGRRSGDAAGAVLLCLRLASFRSIWLHRNVSDNDFRICLHALMLPVSVHRSNDSNWRYGQASQPGHFRHVRSAKFLHAQPRDNTLQRSQR